MSRASSSPGRKEEFPLASDCLTCKNVAFVAGLHSFFWQAVCDQLSPFPPLSLFLCHFTCLPSNPFSLDSAQLQPLQRNSEPDWLAGYCPVVCYSSPTSPWIFLCKCPEVAGVNLSGSGCPLPHPSTPTKEIWPHIVPLPGNRYRFPAWVRRNLGWDRYRERSCCWKQVCEARREKGAVGCQMVLSGSPDLVPGGAEQQKAETGMLAGIQSCRKACQYGVPPGETREDHMTVSTDC